MLRVVNLTAPARCEYLPDQTSRLAYDVPSGLTAADYQTLLLDGWRRFGAVVFRPHCPSCRKCQSLRVPVATFRPNESQRRAWRRNAGDVEIRVGTPQHSIETLALYDRFHRYQHEAKGWPYDPEHVPAVFADNPFRTEEWTYHLGSRLIGVGYVDALPAGLSAIYFFWEPDQRSRSLGTFNVLSLIEAARQRGLPHVYLGYYVEGCGSLEYKARFRPNEILTLDLGWQPFSAPP